MAIAKRIRFEVFKRDKFTCQYCGQKAPDVILQIDHIEPKSLEGSDNILNLVTSCDACNSGKSNVRLTDDIALNKQRKQLETLQERREQLDMMLQWQRGLAACELDEINGLVELWEEYIVGYTLTEIGRADLRKWVRRFGMVELAEAMRIAAASYLDYDADGHLLADSVGLAFQRISGICVVRQRQREDPNAAQVYYIRGILRNRLNYVNERLVIGLIQQAVDKGVNIETIKREATMVRSWSEFTQVLEMLEEEVAK